MRVRSFRLLSLLVLLAWGASTLPAEQSTGRKVSSPLFYYCFGLFKIAVIIQQIYARFVRGHTHDPRFARLNEVVAVVSQQADRAIEAGTI